MEMKIDEAHSLEKPIISDDKEESTTEEEQHLILNSEIFTFAAKPSSAMASVDQEVHLFNKNKNQQRAENAFHELSR